MCGIAGILRWKGAPQRDGEIEAMTAAIAHRGPDGVGSFRRDGVALGHRRLAIIDPELGIQPMSDPSETIWLIYNGELYNFRELKKQLEDRGHKFVTHSDTEVVIHAYQEWGPECVRKFRGMFAFAIADFQKRVLFLARDQLGIKPLYYRLGDGYLAFASELAAIRKVDDCAPTGSLDAVEMYLRFNYVPTPNTIYREVFKLPPASYLVADFDGKHGEPVRYWDMTFEPANSLSDQGWIDRGEEVIRDSVKAHLVADVPFGVFLSGGVDSTLVAWQMSELLGTTVHAFAIGFHEKEYSELAYAEEAARRCGIELHTEIVKDDGLEILPELVAHYGEPFGDSSCIPTWYVSKLAREHVPMVLSGDGGDEAFGGYPRYDMWMQSDPRVEAKRLLQSSVQSAGGLSPRASLYWFRKSVRRFMDSGGNELSKWQDLMTFVHAPIRDRLWRREYQDVFKLRSNLFDQADRKARDWQRLSYAQYLDIQTYLPCDILTKVDVASMYHGLEVRTPLVDRCVMEFASKLPLSQRYRSRSGKYIMKKVLEKLFPPEFINRPKMGFGIPQKNWFYEGWSGRDLWKRVTEDDRAPLFQWFERERVRSLLDEHTPGQDNSNYLWLLLVLGLWLEQNPEVSFNQS